jgi:hypothetical protein
MVAGSTIRPVPFAAWPTGDAVDLLTLLADVHSFWRYAVLIAAVVAIVGALGGWLGALAPGASARRAGLLYVIALDIQVLIGIILWFARGGLAQPPPFRLEHPLIMLLAAVVAHIGQLLARRARAPTAAARAVTIAVAVSLVLVLVGIPGLMPGR